MSKPKIYLFCTPMYSGSGAVNGSTGGGDVCGHAVTEQNLEIASHISSSEEFSKYDLGLTSTRKHDRYAALYPEGYELVWVTPDFIVNHQEFIDAR